MKSLRKFNHVSRENALNRRAFYLTMIYIFWGLIGLILAVPAGIYPAVATAAQERTGVDGCGKPEAANYWYSRGIYLSQESCRWLESYERKSHSLGS